MQSNKDGSLKGKEEQIENRKMEGAGDSNNNSNSKVDETLPPGFRFHPTDEELITYYLINKISDANFTGRAIGDVDLNKSEPWDLPGKAKMGEKEWYFFSLRDRKYPTGVRTNRATNTGYWKTTGKDKEIFNSVTSELVGMKKTLVFYRGRAPRGEKTNWVMHEYRIIHSKSALRNTKDEWVVSRVFQKSAGIKKYPTNQARAVMNPYGLEIGSSTHHIMASPLMLQQAQAAHDHNNFQFPLGRSYINNAELAELTRSLLRGGGGGGGGGGSNISLPINNNNYSMPMQPMAMPNMGGGGSGEGGFTISGLNLNLGGAAAATQQQPVLRPMQVAPPLSIGHHQDHMNSSSSSSMMHANSQLGAAGFGAEMNGSGTSNRSYMGMDNCVDLDSYWPAY